MAKNVLFVGHSLVGTTMPQMLNNLLADRATGIGKNAAQFVLTRGSDTDRITDFKVLEGDMLRLDNAWWAVVPHTRQIVQRNAHVTAAGVVFDFGSGDTITRQSVHTLDGLASHISLF